MADNSIADKLHINSDESLTIFNPPENSEELLKGANENISISDGDPAEVVLAFIDNAKQLKRNLLNLKSNIKKDGTLWLLWQRNDTENNINRDFVIDYSQTKSLGKVSEFDVGGDWSAIQFKIK